MIKSEFTNCELKNFADAAYLVQRGVRLLATVQVREIDIQKTDEFSGFDYFKNALKSVLPKDNDHHPSCIKVIPFAIPFEFEKYHWIDGGYAAYPWALDLYKWTMKNVDNPTVINRIQGLLYGYSGYAIQKFEDECKLKNLLPLPDPPRWI